MAEEAHEARLAHDRNKKNNKRRKVAEETHEELEARLVAEEEARRARAHKKYLLRKSRETSQQRIIRLSKNRTTLRQRCDMEGVSTSDQKLLHKFRNIISNLRNNLCITCNERFPSIVLAGEECRRCCKENRPKRFSIENNMDPGESKTFFLNIDLNLMDSRVFTFF